MNGNEVQRQKNKLLVRRTDAKLSKRNLRNLVYLILTAVILALVLFSNIHLPFDKPNIQESRLGVNSADAASSVSASINVLSDIEEGAGSYFEPYVLNNNFVEWQIHIDGANKENFLYKVDVHMEHYRSCATVEKWDDLTWEDIQARDGKFQYTTTMPGWYYLRIDVNENGTYEELTDARTHIFFRIPPVKPYTLPYSPPPENLKPEPGAEILNSIGGSGGYTDPFVIDSPIIEFRIDVTTDPNGEEDLMYGVYLWAIHMDGHHPVYAKEQGTRIAEESFLYYHEVKNVIFTWDTRERPSTDGRYTLHVPVIDQYGEKNETKYEFIVSSSCSCGAWQDQGCGSGSCPAGLMSQTRSCTPSSCSIQSRCIESLICTPGFEGEDINQDNLVNQIDLDLCRGVVLAMEGDPMITERADINNDGKVNTEDLQRVINKILGK
jgi:hypothetical protein